MERSYQNNQLLYECEEWSITVGDVSMILETLPLGSIHSIHVTDENLFMKNELTITNGSTKSQLVSLSLPFTTLFI